MSRPIGTRVDAFRAAVTSGRSPRIEAFLDGDPQADAELLALLLPIEIADRCSRGQHAEVQEYVARFPAHAGLVRKIIAHRQHVASFFDEHFDGGHLQKRATTKYPRNDAEDLCQDAALKLLQVLKEGGPSHTQNVPALNARILHTQFLMQCRERQRRELREASRARHAAAGNDDPVVFMRAALEMIPDEHRQPLELQFLEGYTAAEAAPHLRITPEAFTARVDRALEALAAVFDAVRCVANAARNPQIAADAIRNAFLALQRCPEERG